MIRVARTPEPADFAAVRTDRLAAARDAIKQGKKIEFKEYDRVKAGLAAMQHNKCCYCEKREEQAKSRDVEHYRPKSGYWWLAWTWENLLFSCIDCNREQKQNRFPLSLGDTALVAEQPPPGGENPLILDPSDPAVDPTMEIEFRKERVHGKERWVPHGLTGRGRKTVSVCGLDRPNLLDLYSEHVNHYVRPKLAPLFAAAEQKDARGVIEAWNTARRGLLGSVRPFRALSYDALLVLVQAELRHGYHLTLERPQP